MSIGTVFAKFAASRAFLYLKLIAITALVAGGMALTWKYQRAIAAQEKQEAVNIAVNAAVKKANDELKEEREWRAAFMKLSNENLTQMLEQIRGITKAQEKFQDDVRGEIAKFPEFYTQQLPDGGYEAWKQSRARLQQP